MNSQGRQAVDQDRGKSPRTEDATLPPDMPFVVFNPMPIQSFNELTLEISSSMAADVFLEFICHARAAVVAFIQARKFLQGEAQLQGFLWNGAWYDKCLPIRQ